LYYLKCALVLLLCDKSDNEILRKLLVNKIAVHHFYRFWLTYPYPNLMHTISQSAYIDAIHHPLG